MGNLSSPPSPEALCSSNGPLQNPQGEALLVPVLIKNKPTTKRHKTKETRNWELIDERVSQETTLRYFGFNHIKFLHLILAFEKLKCIHLVR